MAIGLASATGCGQSSNGDSELNGDCSKYPRSTRTDSDGTTWSWWYLHWQNASTDLDAFCATFGADASMIVEATFPRNPAPTSTLPLCSQDEILNGSDRPCAVADAYRFEAPCTAGELLFELPSDAAFNGYYHFESPDVPGLPRHLVRQDVHCTRDLFIVAPTPGPTPLGADGGAW